MMKIYSVIFSKLKNILDISVSLFFFCKKKKKKKKKEKKKKRLIPIEQHLIK